MAAGAAQPKRERPRPTCRRPRRARLATSACTATGADDEYFWLRDRDDPRTLAYLKAENAYADAWFAPRAALKETLYQEMLSRIQQDDDSVPMRKGEWWYATQTRPGEQYPRYLRRRASAPSGATTRAAATRRCSTSTSWRATSRSCAWA